MLTTPDNIWTPDPGENFNITTDLAASAASVQTALNRRANAYVGTTLERLAADPPVGASWRDTDGVMGSWVRVAGGWAPAPGGVFNVATEAERDSILDSIQSGGINLSTYPLYVLRGDTGELQIFAGSKWVTIGGPPETAKAKHVDVHWGWEGDVYYSQSGGMCTVSFSLTRTHTSFHIGAWYVATFANGLPPNVQNKPAGAINLQLGAVLSNAAENSTDWWGVSVDGEGWLGLQSRWATRLYPQNCWWSGSFSYPTAI